MSAAASPQQNDAPPVVIPSAPQVTASEASSGAELDPAAEPEAEADAGPTRLRMRRAPRYLPFGVTGTGLGVALGIVLALTFSVASDYSTQTIIGYFAAIFGLFGAVLGLGLAVLIERRRS